MSDGDDGVAFDGFADEEPTTSKGPAAGANSLRGDMDASPRGPDGQDSFRSSSLRPEASRSVAELGGDTPSPLPSGGGAYERSPSLAPSLTPERSLRHTQSQRSGYHTPTRGGVAGGGVSPRSGGGSGASTPRGEGSMLDPGQERRTARFSPAITERRGSSLLEAPGSAPARLRGGSGMAASTAPSGWDSPRDQTMAGSTTLTARQETTVSRSFRTGMRHQGWLFKMVRRHHATDAAWKKYWFYLVDDRLYYNLHGSSHTEAEHGGDGKVRYIALDRVPVRPLPHRHTPYRDAGSLTLPDVGVSLVSPRVLQSAGVKIAPGTVFGVVAGSHTYFLAADTPQEAATWVKVLREHWVHCFKHPLRAADIKDSSAVHNMSLMLAENSTLRKSLKDAAASANGVDSHYWSKWLEEKTLNRQLRDKFDTDAVYEVEVKTGRMKGASSDARVYVEMFAAHSEESSGELRCANVDLPRKAFQRNGLDLFEFKMKNVGLPGHLKVWHDNTGRHPDWFLEFIRVRKKTKTGKGIWAMFPCQRWFSTTLDDCRISRILFAGHATPLITYKVVSVTSDLRGAGTDSNVFLIMHGVLGDGDRHILSSSADDFDRATTNEFSVLDEELGDLLEVTVGHDGVGLGASWHLDHLAITNTKTLETFWFPCRQWFDTRIGDGAIQRTLAVGDGPGHQATYNFLITTSDLRGAGTDADVHVVLHGDLGDTPVVVLPSRPEHFERAQTDTFVLQLPHVGTIRTLTVGHNNMGRGPSWHLDMVQVVDVEKGDVYFFSCNKWLATDHDDGLIERTLRAVSEDPSASATMYTIEFHTSKERGAGTDANVFFQLHGTTGSSAVHKVVAPKEAFERGSVDSFKYKMRFMGVLQRLIIQHDNTGENAAWHLLKVVVTCARDKSMTVFACNEWLQSGDKSVYPSVELFAGGVLPDVLRYKLVAVTSDTRGSGTDSKVSVELFGSNGRVGPIHLDQDGSFERGKTDTFIFEGPDVGSMVKLVVTALGQGQRPAWHLDHMVLWRDAAHDELESSTYFRCRDWFDRDHGLVKTLLPERHPGHTVKVPYDIKVHTSDIKGAGTDAGVDVNFVGDLGQTGFVRLVANYDILERGHEDVFQEQLHNIGRAHYCIVRSDGKSRKPAWHVGTLVLDSHGRMPPAYFLGDQWLGPDTRLEVKLQAVFLDPRVAKTEYSVTVITSDVKHAGTDMGVVVEVLGERGSSGRHALVDGGKDTFERGQTDHFRIHCPPLGHLASLRLVVDGKGTPWHLQMVIVQGQEGHKYYFPYNGWLGAQTPAVEIPAQLSDPTEDFKTYRLITHTSLVQGAGTDANVYAELCGGRGSSGKAMLRNTHSSNFEAGKADEFSIGPLSDLGPLTELVIGHDNVGNHPGWHLDAVQVIDTKTNAVYWFGCDQWLAKAQGDGATERTLRAVLSDPRRAKASYTVKVRTSDVPGAGTTSNVYIDILGTLASTGKKMLAGSKALKPFDRNTTDEFIIATVPLGPLRQMLLGHDASGADPRWHVEYVEVTDNANGQTWWFDCQQWLDPTSGDKLTERILQAANKKPGVRKTEVLVVVKTSALEGAGTDANVHLELHGDTISSGRLMLKAPGNPFEAGQADQFKLLVRDVFPLKKITIGHDNAGRGPAWHLEYVEVTNLRTGEKYMFPCKRWLSKSHGDLRIERDLHPLGSGLEEQPEVEKPPPVVEKWRPPPPPEDSTVEYEVTVLTSDISGAGTDANVYIQIMGSDGTAGPLQLDNPKNNFERGARDVFVVKADNVGELESIRLRSDDKGMGSAWHCEMVIIVHRVMNKTFYFYCGQWLSKAEGLEKVLAASLTDPRNSLATYTVITHTSALRGAGTDANVFVDLKGTLGATGARGLEGKGNNFEKGKSDTFPLKSVDLGELETLDVWHDNGGIGPGWHLDYIEVHSSASNKVYYFPCSQWFDKSEGDGLIRRTLLATLKDPRTFKAKYRVSVTTSDISGAGTNANVFINIYGADGETGKVNLDNPGRDDFERNQVDIFELESLNVGPMSKIRIGHDGTGMGAGWHLARVEVENLATGECVTFECNRWFDTKEDDHAIERDLFPTAGGEANGPQQHWKLIIFTGDELGAGTDADVSVSLGGSEGRYGPHLLTAKKGAFERGGKDEFSLSTSPLGVIAEMTLGHNGKGNGAAWLLDKAILEDVATGEKYIFEFGAWLDAKNGMFRTVQPSRHLAPTHAPGQLCDYRLELTPGNGEDGNLLDGEVFVDIRGQDGQTGRQNIPLPPAGFTSGIFQGYNLSALADVGILRQLEVGHTGTTPWQIDKIVVVNLTNGHRGVFIASRPLQPHEALLLDVLALPPVDYKVDVKTGDAFGAGTGARVFISIFGSEGTTGELTLKDEPIKSRGMCGDICTPSAFGRGRLDTFVLRQQPDVGNFTQIEIGHESGSWHLSWVQVTNMMTGQVGTFKCGRWLDDSNLKEMLDAEEAAQAQVAAPPPGFFDQAPAVGPSTLLDPYGPPDPRLVAALSGAFLSKLGNTVGAPGYKVTFSTGNALCAGTGAQVFFEIVGTNGSSGTILTPAGSGQFSRNATDNFIFSRLPFLGNLLQLRVGTRGDGMFATWHLRSADVVHIASGRRYQFDCHGWIDKKTNWQRVLPLTEAI